MKTHCIPPRQTCRRCQAEVQAAQMTEREWRRALWFHEVGFWIATAVSVTGVFAGVVLGIYIDEVVKVNFLPWLKWLAADVVVAIISFVLAVTWSPKQVYLNTSVEYWDERDSYLAAKVAREQHEAEVWKAGVAVLKAQEAARGEIER